MRRSFANMLTELIEAAGPAEEAGLRITGLQVDLPIEVHLQGSSDQLELLVDVPQWRWQGGFEEQLGRLAVTWDSQQAGCDLG